MLDARHEGSLSIGTVRLSLKSCPTCGKDSQRRTNVFGTHCVLYRKCSGPQARRSTNLTNRLLDSRFRGNDNVLDDK